MHNILPHSLKRMNLTDSDIWTQNIYSSAIHSIEKDKKQKISPAYTGKQEEKWREIKNPSH